jgi:hypothetical protein
MPVDQGWGLVERAIGNEGRVIIVGNGLKRLMAFATFGLVIEQGL